MIGRGETVVRLRRGPSPGRDPRGQPIPGPLTETEMPGCVVAPRTGWSEAPSAGGTLQQARDTVIVGYIVYDPQRRDWQTTDQVRIRGEVCGITGQPGDWARNPFTGTGAPLEFAADRVTG
ncbi:hypothetical protein [Streptomyces phytophilus]|uniref:hypothetical protein n=1 Tax=Streptomyces phytophilus TaxID=722715 RepID=UPI0015EFEAE2|nr:hypothetical protein [Streptomyces phytophilus]